MSANVQPIPNSQFALAIQDLPLENIYAKAQEIENSISHLLHSNAQLRDYSDSIRNDTSIAGETREEVGDKECLEAIQENEIVIDRQRERIGLLRAELERRGQIWHGAGAAEGAEVNGDRDGEEVVVNIQEPPRANGAAPGGRLTDEELRRRLEQRMRDEGGVDDEEDAGGGLHL